MAKILGGSRAARGLRVAFWLLLAVGVGRLCGDDGNIERKIERLRAEIAHHDEFYFKKAAPEISDEAYDRLKRELAELERQAGKDVEGEERVGDDRNGRFPTWRHGERMLSLAKVYSEAELRTFLKRIETDIGANAAGAGASWVAEPKYDGLAISATYERGVLVRVATRGDGIEGDDVTENARRIDGLPKKLAGNDWPERIELRGEALTSFANFERVNAARAAAGETLFANPRALAAGSLKLDDPETVAQRGLSVVFYGWGEVVPEDASPAAQSAFHARVREWGLPGVAEISRARTVAEACAWVRAFERRRGELTFPTDGAVIKLDDVGQQKRLGATEHAPRWAVAYKFSTERAETRVKAIAIQVGRSGVLTPVAELEPVKLGGAVVARATLHNAAEIARMDVRVGDVVFVEKAGEVIPAVTGVDRSKRGTAVEAYSFPEDCPVCGAAVVTRMEGGARQYCPNRGCAAQVAARLKHFAGANGVAIRGLGEETIAGLVGKRGVRSLADLYRLTREDWLALPGVGVKTAGKLMEAVEASKRAELWRWVNGLGVPGVGVATSRILAGRFTSLEELAAASEAALARIDGVGAVQAEAIAGFFAADETRAMLADLRARGVTPRRLETGKATAQAGRRPESVTDQ